MKLWKNGFFLVLIISIAAAAAFQAVKPRTQARLEQKIAMSVELTRQAQEELREGEVSETGEKLRRALALNRLNAETYLYLAMLELREENYQSAYENYASAVNMEITAVDIILNLVNMLVRSGHYDLAGTYLRHGLMDFPESEELLLLSAKFNLLQGDYQASLETLQSLVDSGNNLEEIYLCLGLNYYFRGERERAAQYYRDYFALAGAAAERETADVELMHEKALQLWGETIWTIKI